MDTMPNYAGYLTLEAVAVRCGVNTPRVRNWVLSGVKTETGRIRLAAVKLGASWRVDPTAIAPFIDAVTRAALPSVADTATTAPVKISPTAADKRELEACMARLKAAGRVQLPTRTKKGIPV